jgi:sterol-4alpha-carboxylate 3-dehydrogenase (decarboxylating)
LFWEFQRLISAAIGLPTKDGDIKVIPKWLALLMTVIWEYVVWISSFGTRQPSVTRESVRLTTIIHTLNGDKAKRVLGYTPKVGILEGIERSGKWFVEEAKKAEGGKKNN